MIIGHDERNTFPAQDRLLVKEIYGRSLFGHSAVPFENVRFAIEIPTRQGEMERPDSTHSHVPTDEPHS